MHLDKGYKARVTSDVGSAFLGLFYIINILDIIFSQSQKHIL